MKSGAPLETAIWGDLGWGDAEHPPNNALSSALLVITSASWLLTAWVARGLILPSLLYRSSNHKSATANTVSPR